MRFLEEEKPKSTLKLDDEVLLSDHVTEGAELSYNLLNLSPVTQKRAFSRLYLSTICSACAREEALGFLTGEKRTKKFFAAQNLMMNMGSAIHYYIQNNPDQFFEKDKFLGNWVCYDKETEVLTESGFKFFKDVKMTDKIATRNTKTQELEYHFPTAKQVIPYKGDMVEIVNSRLLSLKVTPEHNMYVRRFPRRKVKGKKRDFELIEMKEIEQDYGFEVMKWAKWVGKDTNVYLPGRGYISPRLYVRFMAMFISDGVVIPRRNRVDIYQRTQNPGRVVTEEVLEELGYKYHYLSGNKGVSFCDSMLPVYLEPLGKSINKYLPSELKNLSVKYLRKFIDSYAKGDGTVDSKGRITLYTSSKQLRDDLQEVILKAGWGSSVIADDRYLNGIGSKINGQTVLGNCPVYHIGVFKNDLEVCVGRRYGNDLKRVFYDDFVYDLTVPNHTLFVRRHGKVMWSGNCLSCKRMRRFGCKPKEPCEMCGASADATVYSEYHFRLDNPYRVSGKVDGILDVGQGKYRFLDIKTYGARAELTHPEGDHVAQVASYMYFHQYDNEKNKLPIEIDQEYGYVMYFMKVMNMRSPVKTFKVQPTERMLEPLITKAEQYAIAAQTGQLPDPLNLCITSNWSSTRAKGCSMRKYCQQYFEQNVERLVPPGFK